uniref:Uncharacterized protein n=1 Tax=Anguilla anguilla TaxID=7936 RepID=A0A0E9VP22_ANGAN
MHFTCKRRAKDLQPSIKYDNFIEIMLISPNNFGTPKMSGLCTKRTAST